MTGPGAFLRAFKTDRRGLAAVEFSLVAPLLILMFGIAVEVGRLLIAQRQFEAAVVGVARHVARYPEYEIRARAYAVPIAKSIFPGDGASLLNLKVDSLVKEDGILKEVFPGNVITGVDPGLDWRNFVSKADFVNEEAVIFVSASYSYRPLLMFMSSYAFEMKKDVVVLPAFGRKYPWNDGKIDENSYVF